MLNSNEEQQASTIHYKKTITLAVRSTIQYSNAEVGNINLSSHLAHIDGLKGLFFNIALLYFDFSTPQG